MKVRNFERFYLKTLRCKARVVPALYGRYVVGHIYRCGKCACARVAVCVHAVCVYVSVLSVCVSGTTSPATMRNGESNQRYLQHRRNLENILNMAFSLCSRPTSLVCAYRNIIWRRCSDISPEISKTEPFLVLSKSNGRLQATWQRATSLSAVQLVQSFFFCSLRYTFRYMFVNACAFSEPRARATPRPAK